MNKIASFTVDHDKLKRGMYLSRVDGDVITYDIRMRVPNKGDYLTNAALHSFEHLFATYARNSALSDNVIYVGPMGCRTGFYFLTRGISNRAAIDLVIDCFKKIAVHEGEIPGATQKECGNYKEQDLAGAKKEASAMLEVLENITEADLIYEK